MAGQRVLLKDDDMPELILQLDKIGFELHRACGGRRADRRGPVCPYPGAAVQRADNVARLGGDPLTTPDRIRTARRRSNQVMFASHAPRPLRGRTKVMVAPLGRKARYAGMLRRRMLVVGVQVIWGSSRLLGPGLGAGVGSPPARPARKSGT